MKTQQEHFDRLKEIIKNENNEIYHHNPIDRMIRWYLTRFKDKEGYDKLRLLHQRYIGRIENKQNVKDLLSTINYN